MISRLLLTAVAAAALASAQRGGGGGGGMGELGAENGGGGGGGMNRGNDGMGGGMSPQTRKPTKAEQFADKLKLSKDQREEVQTIFSAAFERAGSVRAEMDKQRAQIAGAMIDGKTGDDLNKVVEGYAAASAQLTKIEAETFAKVYALLKPNQQGKAAEAFELMAGIFTPPVSGRGGARRGMGVGGMGGGGGMGRGRGGR